MCVFRPLSHATSFSVSLSLRAYANEYSESSSVPCTRMCTETECLQRRSGCRRGHSLTLKHVGRGFQRVGWGKMVYVRVCAYVCVPSPTRSHSHAHTLPVSLSVSLPVSLCLSPCLSLSLSLSLSHSLTHTFPLSSSPIPKDSRTSHCRGLALPNSSSLEGQPDRKW